MKPIRILLLLVIIFTFRFVCAQENALLWEISKEGYHTSYLYGTMHIKDPRVFAFNDSLLPCLQSCEAYAGELIFDLENMMQYMSFLFEKDPKKQCRNVLNNEELFTVNTYIKENSQKELLLLVPYSSPYMVALMVSMGNLNSTDSTASNLHTFLDLYLQGYADSLGHQLISLETFDGQLSYIKNIEIDKQKDYLLRMISNGDVKDFVDFEQLISIYEKENLDSLYQLVMQNPEKDPLITDGFINDRNVIQKNSMLAAMQNQKTFVAVGAAHLVGDKGIIALLRNEGFLVRPMYKNR